MMLFFHDIFSGNLLEGSPPQDILGIPKGVLIGSLELWVDAKYIFIFRPTFDAQVDRRIQRILGDAPHMEHAGSDVALIINSGCLRISTLESNTVVACHDMPNISFASGGDPVHHFLFVSVHFSLLSIDILKRVSLHFCLH